MRVTFDNDRDVQFPGFAVYFIWGDQGRGVMLKVWHSVVILEMGEGSDDR